jgi:ABC-type polysaccharide/polyol phosphate transport system ATPase subunit
MSIISLHQVSKRHRVSRLGTATIREALTRWARRLVSPADDTSDADEIYALRDVSLDIARGETVGLIGPNGAGKSTLLKLIARVSYPTTGTVTVRGTVASLMEVGAGFHPELSGRDNIFLYGSILGMRRGEIRAKLDRIVEFAEIERFLDTPVKRYSTGMYVRLGFAVAAHVEADALLLDEVLAVGDARFQSKCLQRVEELRRGGTTIILVSHDMSAIERLCRRVIFLEGGQVRADGEPRDSIEAYYRAVVFAKPIVPTGAPVDQPAWQHLTRDVEIADVTFHDRHGTPTDRLATGDPFTVRVRLTVHQPLEDPVVDLLFYSVDDRLMLHYTTSDTTPDDGRIEHLDRAGVVEIASDALGLLPGVYRVDATVSQRDAVDAVDWKLRSYPLHVLPGRAVRGQFYAPHRWRLLPSEEQRLAPSVGRPSSGLPDDGAAAWIEP